jgi:hypothetical protein
MMLAGLYPLHDAGTIFFQFTSSVMFVAAFVVDLNGGQERRRAMTWRRLGRGSAPCGREQCRFFFFFFCFSYRLRCYLMLL